MKKIVSVSIVVCLISAFAGLCASAADTDIPGFTVISDTHFEAAATYGSIADVQNISDEMYHHTTIQGEMDAESQAILDSFLDTFRSSQDRILLICGDLTNGRRSDHIALADKLTRFMDETGKRIYVIDGNHDCRATASENRIDYKEFKNIYAGCGYSDALSVDEASCSYTADLGGGLRLIAVDSCIYGKDEGKISDSTLEWVKQQAEQAKKDGVQLIAMMHHSLLPHYTVEPMADNYLAVANEFAGLNIKYVFSGHIHANDITQSVSSCGRKIYDILTGSLTTMPNAYRHVEMKSGSVSITTSYVSSIDTPELPQGYTEAQLALISSDFPAYAQGYYDAGVGLWIHRFLGSADRISRLLKIDKTASPQAYAELDRIMSVIESSLELPIYDDGSTPGVVDSLQEIARLGGGDIPAGNMQYFKQDAAAIMGGFFRGDEKLTADSYEIRLLWAVLKSAVPYALSRYSGAGGKLTALSAALQSSFGVSLPDLPEAVLSDTAELNFYSQNSGALIRTLVDPIIEGISCDAYAPADLNVTLEGYGAASSFDFFSDSAAMTWLGRIIEYFRDLFNLLFRAAYI